MGDQTKPTDQKVEELLDAQSGNQKNPVPKDVPNHFARLFTQSGSSWANLRKKARTIAQISALFIFLITLGAVGGFYANNLRQPNTKSNDSTVTSLSQDEINKLTQVGGSLGSNGQVLNIGADALFRGKLDVSGDLSIGGRLNANGPVTLSALNIAGASGTTGLNVGTNLVVGGTATFQKSIAVTELASVTNLSVSGNASVNSLNATNIAVRTIAISGPLTIGHLSTQGAVPSINAVSVGSGGTVSISGNDTAGTININIGNSPGTNVTLANITFRAAYGTNTHVLITPLTDAAATAGAYVTHSAAGFQIHAHSNPGGAVMSFDYLVVQ